jgi:hypothetical protein
MPAQRVVFAVVATSFEILVAFVRSYNDRCAGMIGGAGGLENVCGAHDISGEGLLRLLVRATDERLCGKMEDDARARGGKRGGHRLGIADIRDHVIEALVQAELAKERRVGVGFKREAVDFGAELKQPLAEPTAFEAGVPGDEHSESRVGAVEIFQNEGACVRRK